MRFIWKPENSNVNLINSIKNQKLFLINHWKNMALPRFNTVLTMNNRSAMLGDITHFGAT